MNELKHVSRIIEGVELIYREDLKVFNRLNKFPKCCGAGSGVGNIIVPDTVFGLSISPACYGHDDDWEYSPPTWEAYHASNSRFLRNMLAIINAKSSNWFIRLLRRYRAVTYYNAVDEIYVVFWAIKKNQIKKGMWIEYNLKDIKVTYG